jgi:hypothetical protein
MSTAPGPRPLGQRKKDYGLISDAQLAETVVATSRGLRHVRPYLYDFTAHCKRRWVGEPVLDVVASEFVGLSRADFERAIAQQPPARQRRADRRRARRFRDGDALLHRVHRHEEPVSGEPLRVIRYDDRRRLPIMPPSSAVIAVDKPRLDSRAPGRPLSPPGAHVSPGARAQFAPVSSFRIASIALTSGVVLVGTSPEAAAAVARLIGDGSHAQVLPGAGARSLSLHAHAAAFVRVDVPIVVRGGYQGVCATGADGKRAITYVRALAYDAARDLSVVLCVCPSPVARTRFACTCSTSASRSPTTRSTARLPPQPTTRSAVRFCPMARRSVRGNETRSIQRREQRKSSSCERMTTTTTTTTTTMITDCRCTYCCYQSLVSFCQTMSVTFASIVRIQRTIRRPRRS